MYSRHSNCVLGPHSDLLHPAVGEVSGLSFQTSLSEVNPLNPEVRKVWVDLGENQITRTDLCARQPTPLSTALPSFINCERSSDQRHLLRCENHSRENQQEFNKVGEEDGK